jgi:CRISPR-associated Csx14 family protein
MAEDDQKDFFISYCSEDRTWAEWIAWQLEMVGYSCLIQAWDFRPGSNFIENMHEAVEHAKCTLAVLSPDYFESPYTKAEWMAVLALHMKGGHRKLLPVRVSECDPPGLLTSIVYIDFVQTDVTVARKRLLAGVQGARIKPSKPPVFPGVASSSSPKMPGFPGKSNVLISSLGDSPAVVSAMYDLLTKQEKLSIDRLVVLCPQGKDEELAYQLVKKALPELVNEGRLICESLQFQDADSWRNACVFLKSLCNRLEHYQESDVAVYLSLAGGRKSMAALMGWVAPFFPCIEKLYHVIDKEEQKGSHHFLSVNAISLRTGDKFAQVMHPPLSQLTLVDIPFEKEWQLGKARIAELLAATPDELAEKEYEEEQALIAFQNIFARGNMLDVKVTKTAALQYHTLNQGDEATARVVRNRLLRMDNVSVLQHEVQRYGTDAENCIIKIGKKGKKSARLHYLKGYKAPVHPIFFTEPGDIAEYPDQEVNRAVICALEMGKTEGYRALEEVKTALKMSVIEVDDIDVSLPMPPPIPVESVLIVPLGTSPMVATQLYTLLTQQQKRTIREIVLIYPAQSTLIHSGAEMIKDILSAEACCRKVGVPGHNDMDSSDACREFQQVLEAEIERVRREYPLCKVDLALSGGRKGMTAMTIFAAQRKHIPYVYHTLITDSDLSERIEQETTIEELIDTGLTEKEINARLFLEAYEPYPYAHFTLFRVPVFSAEN